MANSFIRAAREGAIRTIAGGGAADRFLEKLEGPCRFACVIGSTGTAEIEGISAAGETPYLRRFTAALDAEYLFFGRTLTMDDVPRNPLGPPSPVVISRAALTSMGVAPLIVDAGTAVPPLTPRLALGGLAGRCITTGRALDVPECYPSSLRLAARALAPDSGYVVLAESVPGGTTTALSVLTALGVDARGMVSSSMPGGNHGLKEKVVRDAIERAALGPDRTALEIVSAVGDPMQLAVPYLALELSLSVPVVLGGGTQMAAVLAIIARLLAEGEPGDPANIALATTAWVADDRASDIRGIMECLPVRFGAFASMLDFSGCSHEGLRRYQEGLVKEGVGAGAAAFAAVGQGATDIDTLTRRIDRLAEELDEQKS